ETYDVYVPTLLAALDREEDALAEIARVGRRRKANLAKVKRELAAAKFPADADTLLLNAFIRAYNFMWSWLSDEAERVRNSLTRGRKQRLAKAEKAKLIVTADRLSEKANAWLDTFPSGEMSVEAAAFMYLMSGIEKIRR
ncbi:MAG TPA: hypothetical protein VEB19_07675, partial [Gemmatimonadaceae bacterium]|nr:hypothetical protein [Gemmatimonadaceae bacterium]